jgi:zinc transport system substrate-binding protein
MPHPLRPAILALLVFSPAAEAAAPRVVADIGPVQSIVARVMQGVGQPGLILPPGASPHGYALRPSEARQLQEADVVVWIGPALTPWLADPISRLAPDATLVTLENAAGVGTLPVRAGGPFEPHTHDEHGHDERGHDESGQDDTGAIDGHLWLDPDNAVAAARATAAVLAGADPGNAGAYAANAEAFAAETAAQSARIAARLAHLQDRPFIVFHDGFQYFERRFGLPAAGSVALHDGDAPGTARIAAIRDQARTAGVVCALAEPEFEPALLGTITEGTAVRTAELDGLGAALPPGPTLYPALLDGIVDSLTACLAR